MSFNTVYALLICNTEAVADAARARVWPQGVTLEMQGFPVFLTVNISSDSPYTDEVYEAFQEFVEQYEDDESAPEGYSAVYTDIVMFEELSDTLSEHLVPVEPQEDNE